MTVATDHVSRGSVAISPGPLSPKIVSSCITTVGCATRSSELGKMGRTRCSSTRSISSRACARSCRLRECTCCGTTACSRQTRTWRAGAKRRAPWRREIVASLAPAPDVSEPSAAVQMSLLDGEPAPSRPTRHPWAWLLRRVFSADVSVCPKCSGKMRIIEVATEPGHVARVLAELGLGPRPPPRPTPAQRGQLLLRFQSE